MPDSFSEETRRALAQAELEARRLNHASVGTEHLLLGILAVDDCSAARLLNDLGVGLEEARERAGTGVESPVEPAADPPTYTARAWKVLELAQREATVLGRPEVAPEDVLLGMIREGAGVGCQILVAMGVDLGSLREQLSLRSIEAVTEGQAAGSLRQQQETSLTHARRFLAGGERAYPVGAEWTAASVRPGRGPTEFADAYEALQRFAARLGVDVDDSRVSVESVETAVGPGLRLVLRHRVGKAGEGR